MFVSTIYNISIITVDGFSGGIIGLIMQDICKIRQNRPLQSINNIAQVFNFGFYIGSILGLFYIINGGQF